MISKLCFLRNVAKHWVPNMPTLAILTLANVRPNVVSGGGSVGQYSLRAHTPSLKMDLFLNLYTKPFFPECVWGDGDCVHQPHMDCANKRASKQRFLVKQIQHMFF